MAEQKRIYPPFYFFVSLLVIINLHYWYPIKQFVPEPYHYVGLFPMLLGAAIDIWAARFFAKVETAIRPFEKSSHLVRVGFYKRSRNPMYLGMALILSGTALFFGSLSPFFVIPVFIFLLQKNFIKAEERMLLKTFGEEYAEYKKQVRRWI